MENGVVVECFHQEIDGLSQWEQREYRGLSFSRRSKHSPHLLYFTRILVDNFNGKPFKARDAEDFLMKSEEERTNPEFYSSKTFWTPYCRLADLFERGIVERTHSFHYGYWYRFVPESLRKSGL